MVTTGDKLKRCFVIAVLVLPVAGFAKEDAASALAQCKAQAELKHARGQAVTTILANCMSAKGFVLDVNLPISERYKCSATIYPEMSAECYRHTSP